MDDNDDGLCRSLISSDVGYPSRVGVPHQLVIGGQYGLHHIEPGSFEYHVVGGLHVHHVELCDDIVRVRANWERNYARRVCLVPVKPI